MGDIEVDRRKQFPNVLRVRSIGGVILAILLLVALVFGSLIPGVVATAVQSFRVAFALVLVLVLPGFAITVLFPRRTLSLAEGLTIGLGTSLAIAALGGVALNWMPGGIRASGWLVMLGSSVLLCTAYIRRKRPAQLSEWVAELKPRRQGSLRSGLLFGFAALLVTAALLVARYGAIHQPVDGFTEFWALPSDRAGVPSVHLGIQSDEKIAEHYRLELRYGDVVIRVFPDIQLEPGQSWETDVTLPSSSINNVSIEALLYRTDHPVTVYRRVTLWSDG